MLTGYAIGMALLLGMRYALLAAGPEIAALIGAIGVSAIVAGVVRNRPARRAPWLLLAAANLSTMIGRLSLNLANPLNSHAAIAFPNFADAAYLIGYPLQVAGLALFIRSRTAGRDYRGAADALIISAGLALLFWVFLVVPHATDTALSWPQRIVAVAYPLGDLVVLASLARLLAPGRVRGTAVVLVTIAVVGGLGSDVSYELIEYSGAHNTPTLGLGWLVAFIAWGAAALHPSMTKLTKPVAQREQTASKAKVIAVTLASLIPPIVLFTDGLKTRDRVEGIVAVACAILYLLMLSRLWGVVSSHRRGQISERTLRMAGVSLAVAGSVEEVAAAVQQAAFALIGQSPGSGAVLVERKGGRLHAVIPGMDVPEMADPERTGDYPGRRLREMVEDRLPHLDRPTFIAAAEFGGVLPTGARLIDGEGVLICPLMLRDRPSGDPHIGVLAVHGSRRTLDDRAEVLEILAGQAALAVERVSLSQQVIRHRGEMVFRTLVQDTSDVILILDDDGKIRYATPSAGSIFGGVAVEGASLTELVAPSGRDDIGRALDLTGVGVGVGSGVGAGDPGYVLRIERLDGHIVVVEVRSSDLRADPSVGGLVLTLRDVTEQHQLEQELKHRAFHDALTGLPNRALFARRAAQALGQAGRTGRTVGVLFVDLDDFKMVNDTLGHGVGDDLLVAVAARLAAGVRASDTAARFGGDEFALLIDDAPDPEAVDAFAERIVAAFVEPFILGEPTVFAAISVGVATSQDSVDSEEVLSHADLALYAAKSAGKRQWRRYQPVLSAGMIRRREVQSALEDALGNAEFALAYQPLAALASGEIAGFEALIRWPRSPWGMMLPGEFIELAEETGHIVPLGAWVLTQALTDMVAWRTRLNIPTDGLPDVALVPAARLPGPAETEAAVTRAASAGRATAELEYEAAPAAYSRPYVSVNVSARQFRDPGFVDGVRQALWASGLPPSALLLELTESVVLGGTERIRAELDELKEIGVRLAIDDFGTGYSSLSYLLELPIDVLKIDRSFVTGIAASWRRHAIVEGIVRLAATLEVDVIAEGIETETERQLLVGMGCQYGQGYLLSVPVEAAEAEALLGLGHGLVPEVPPRRRKPPTRECLTDL
jgi:diguanylate cyclase (GGDEF)-like protein/PAS domain S-box-containing protein